jgi:hypothetical protein
VKPNVRQRKEQLGVVKRALSAVVLVLALAVPVALYARELLAVDRCMDHGGSFDYAAGTCDFSISHPIVSFESRNQGVLVGSAITSLLAVGLLARRRKEA